MWVGSGGQWRQVFADAIEEAPHTLGITANSGAQPKYVEGTWVNNRTDLQIEIEWYMDNVAQPLRSLSAGFTSARLFEGEWDYSGQSVHFRVRYVSGEVKGPWSPTSSTAFAP